MFTEEELNKIKLFSESIHLNNDIKKKVIVSVCIILNVDVKDIFTNNVNHQVCYARHLIWYILKNKYNYSASVIAKMFNRTSSSIRKSIAIIDLHIKLYKDIQVTYNQIISIL